MEAFFAFLGALLALVLLISISIVVIFPLLSSSQNATEGLAQRLLSWLVLALWALPTTLGTAFGSIITHITSFWKLYLVAFVVAIER